jgi:hypothetical protein
MRTSFNHQPEAQHPHSPAINTPAGRLPHLCAESDRSRHECDLTLSAISGHDADHRAARRASSNSHLASVLREGRKSANIYASLEVILGIPVDICFRHKRCYRCKSFATSHDFFVFVIGAGSK